MIEAFALIFMSVRTAGRNRIHNIGENSMKKKIWLPCLLLIAAVLLTAALSVGVGAAETVTMTEVKNGTAVAEGTEVTISSVEEYGYFAAYVNAGKTTAGIVFRQTADIEFAHIEEGYINFPMVGTAEHPFAGTYEGDGFRLANLEYSTTADDENDTEGLYFAPFAYTDGATVRNLTVALSEDGEYNLYTAGREVAYPYFGGVIGYAKNTSVIACQTTEVTLSAQNDDNADSYLPGMAGIVVKADNSVIDGCVNHLIFTDGKTDIAGIVLQAENGAAVRNCLNRGAIAATASGAARIAGIAATVTGESVVENCYNIGTVTGKDCTGALVGSLGAGAKLQNCFVSGEVKENGGAASATFGLLVGENEGAVSYCYGFDSRRDETKNLALIGANGGTATVNYLFRKNQTEEGTAYVLGEIVERLEEKVLHTEAGATHAAGTTCQECTPDGYVHNKTMYRFVALETKLTIGSVTDIDKLDVALNTWCNELGTEGVAYAAWAVTATGDIVNCTHKNLKFDKEASCAEEVIANEICADCGKVIRENVTLPRKAHTWGAESTCTEQQTCTVCGAVNEEAPLKPHKFPAGLKACEAAKCENCGTDRTTANDPTMTAHTPDRDAADCTHDKVCTVCGAVLEEKTGHVAMPASCEAPRYCTKCGELVHEQLQHTWIPATCSEPRTCKICGTKDDSPEGQATGEHQWNVPEATCTERKYCTVCYLQAAKALGHQPGEEADCGHAQKCERCHSILVNATGEHVFDMSTLTVIKEPADGAWGEYSVKCTHCGLTVVEHFVYLPSVSGNSQADVSAIAGNARLPLGVTIEALQRKIADYKGTKIAEAYTLLQVMDISLRDAAGEIYVMDGKLTVRMQLNKSAAKMAGDKVKLYYIAADGTATEVAIKEWGDGYVTFETDHFSVYAIAADEEAAIQALGAREDGKGDNGDGEDKNTGLPVGAIVGIVIGAVVVVAAVVVVIFVVFGKKQKGAKTDRKDDSDD